MCVCVLGGGGRGEGGISKYKMGILIPPQQTSSLIIDEQCLMIFYLLLSDLLLDSSYSFVISLVTPVVGPRDRRLDLNKTLLC